MIKLEDCIVEIFVVILF